MARVFKWEYNPHLIQITDPVQPSTSPATPITPPKPQTTTMTTKSPQELLYEAAKIALGHRMIITPGVPNLLGCASSLCGVIQKAGYTKMPKNGIEGTPELYEFLRENSDFAPAEGPEPGLILIYPSNQPGAVLEHGHVFVCGVSGLMSNDSDTGLWSEKWTLQTAHDYYHTYGKLNGYFFRPLAIPSAQ